METTKPSVTELIKELAEKLGTTSEYLWKVLVKQARIEAYISIIRTSFIVGLSIPLFIADKYLLTSNFYNTYDEFCIGAVAATGLLYLIVAISTIYESIYDIITGIKNPEGEAFERVSRLFD